MHMDAAVSLAAFAGWTMMLGVFRNPPMCFA
jgi:hypothetical protein